MASWDQLRELALSLPEVVERPGRDWRIRDKLMVWERPLRQADLEALGEHAPEGPIICIWLPSLEAKEALLAAPGETYFTTPHFDGYRAILVRLDSIPLDELEELVIEAWLDRAPKRLVRQWESEREAGGS
jgi:hypothetical protein